MLITGLLTISKTTTGSIVSPPAGMTVSGLVQIIVSANDDRAMGGVAL